MNLFHEDSPLMRVLTRAADLILLNWLFLLCAFPIVTAGAALAALHTVCLQMVRKSDSGIAAAFFRAFRDNFRQATGIWLLLLAGALVLAADFALAPSVMDGALLLAVQAAAFLLAALWLLLFIYVFPIQARYRNSVKTSLKNALILALGNLPNSILLAALHLAVPYLCLRHPGTIPFFVMLSMFLLFSGLAFLSDLLVYRAFCRMIPGERGGEE